jgi:hypothetical protein
VVIATHIVGVAFKELFEQLAGRLVLSHLDLLQGQGMVQEGICRLISQ